jgi:predicted nucleotide-binding protein (sugar kinase/HSP70/actin superfamily)
VASIPNLENIGKTYVLQGGTQKNLAAVKAQVDYIINKFKHSDVEPEIYVHKFTSVCGAIGAALEARSIKPDKSEFIGFSETESIEYNSTYGEDTRCNFCRNKCIRTFIDVKTTALSRRLIIAPCEKGRFEDISEVKKIQKESLKQKLKNPDLINLANKKIWEFHHDSIHRYAEFLNQKQKKQSRKEKTDKNLIKRSEIKIGFPRVLNHYILQPFYNAYFETLGFDPQNFYFSQYTNEEMYRKGSKRGSVDPCFPSKVALSHVSDLMDQYGDVLNYIVFPMVNSFSTGIENLWENKACPTVAGTPEMVYSAFTKEENIFKKRGVEFLKPFLNFAEPGVLEKELFNEWSKIFNLTSQENKVAVRAGYQALKIFKKDMQNQGEKVIENIEKENRLGMVLLGRAYHSDPGINHSIFDLFMEKGYPIIPVSAIPMDAKFLSKYFTPEEIEKDNMLRIDDIWKHSFSSSSSMKIWASKIISRIPNLIPVELSSFKCGHDSTLYSTIEKIFERSSKPFFSFKDIDENNPGGSIRIRVETIDYFLKKYTLEMKEKNKKKQLVHAEVDI